MKFQYTTLEERELIIQNNKDKYLISDQVIVEGNFLIFADDPPIIINEPEPTELEILGQEVAMLKLSNTQKDLTLNTLGQELTNIKLQLLQGGI